VAAFVEQAVELPGPLYLRLGRDDVPMLPVGAPRIGQAQWLRSGSAVAILACGSQAIAAALDAADLLGADGIDAGVVNVHTLKPLDTGAVLAAAETGLVATVEEHWIGGGLGGAVAELLARELPTRMVTIGVPDAFVEEVGDHRDLLAHVGIHGPAIADAVSAALGARSRANHHQHIGRT
jgi:transketolase